VTTNVCIELYDFISLYHTHTRCKNSYYISTKSFKQANVVELTLQHHHRCFFKSNQVEEDWRGQSVNKMHACPNVEMRFE